MQLLDHFRPPLSQRRHWHSFHNAWSTNIAAHLNQQLPEGCFAEPNVQFGIEIDVASFDETDTVTLGTSNWSAPAPTQTLPITIISDVAEVLIFASEGGPTLVGAIELVSPANKDRAAHRDAFVSKCAAYLQQGIGLLIVDIVTDRHANLHEELLARLHADSSQPVTSDLYAVAYRAIERDEQPSVDTWQEALAVGEPLPKLPLWLRGSYCVPVDLDATYERTCRGLRAG